MSLWDMLYRPKSAPEPTVDLNRDAYQMGFNPEDLSGVLQAAVRVMMAEGYSPDEMERALRHWAGQTVWRLNVR